MLGRSFVLRVRSSTYPRREEAVYTSETLAPKYNHVLSVRRFHERFAGDRHKCLPPAKRS